MVNSAGTMSKVRVGEWVWRFLAIVMLFAVGWTMWIIYQLNPPPLIMNAAFEAAAKAKGKEARGEKQVTTGVIAQSGAAASAPAEPGASSPAEMRTPPAAQAPMAPKEPPINAEKLKFSDSITLPVPPAKK